MVANYRSDMYNMVMDFPILLTKFRIDQETQDNCIRLGDEGLGGIAILGMGGSAIAGLYVKALLQDSTPIPIELIRDYSLARCVDSNWIALAVSYSGNTEETVAAYNEAMHRKCQTITISSSERFHVKGQSLANIKIPTGYQPRAAFPILFSAVLSIVQCLLAQDPIKLENISLSLSEKAKNWETSSFSPQTMARDLNGNIPLFIGSSHLIPVAYRAKCQLNENAKAMAFFSEIPEANHNEIESFVADNSFNILPVFLRSSFEDERLRRRIDITENLYEEQGYSPIRLSIGSKDKTEEMLAMTYYLDLVSVELANIRNVDAASVKQISRLKNQLNDDLV